MPRLGSADPLAPAVARRGVRAWLWLVGLLAAGSLLPHFVDPTLLNWQPGLAWSQPWRWWSAAWVHLSAMHLGANLLGAGLLAALGWVARCDRHDVLAWWAAWPLTHLGLLAQPSLTQYAGLSGVLHAGVVVGAFGLIRRERQLRRTVGLVMLAGVGLKLIMEQPWLGPLRMLPGWDFAIAPAAHVSGAGFGGLCALLVGFWPRGERDVGHRA